ADHFMPRQLLRHGDRLVFSNGILVLAGIASLLVLVFQASVNRLIPLYAIGVFTSFTFSQAGMAVHHHREKEPNWRRGLVINGLGAVVSGLVTIIIAAAKFTEGAWVIFIIMPLILLLLFMIHRHYVETGEILRDPARRVPLDFPRQLVIIPDYDNDTNLRAALAYAHRVFPTEIRVVRLAWPGDDVEPFLSKAPFADEVREVALSEGDGTSALKAYVRKVRREVGPGELLNIIVPESIEHLGLTYLYRQRRLQRLKGALLAEPQVVVTNLPMRRGYEKLEPGEQAARSQALSKPWRHVAVVLVASIHNASLSGLRYARSLGADELHAVHIEAVPSETAALQEEWAKAVRGRIPLEVLESPYREIARPALDYVRSILEQRPHTYVTIIIPEFVIRKPWHAALHNHTPLLLKRAFLFEPSVVVAAVPYRLDVMPKARKPGAPPGHPPTAAPREPAGTAS
ncbi:MAG: hypothetical protein ACRDJU_02290, partial [Actinomycetota bacterium]